MRTTDMERQARLGEPTPKFRVRARRHGISHARQQHDTVGKRKRLPFINRSCRIFRM